MDLYTGYVRKDTTCVKLEQAEECAKIVVLAQIQ